MARTLNTLAWNTLYAMYTQLQKEDASSAAEKILAYVDEQVKASEAAGLGTYTQVKASFKNNCVSDKRCRIKKALNGATGYKKTELENKMSLVDIFDDYCKGVTRRHINDVTATEATGTTKSGRVKYLPSKGTLTKSKWKYTAEELQEFEGDFNFWHSVVENSRSAIEKYSELCARYFGPDYDNIMYKARTFAAAKAKEGTMSLIDKIKNGIPVVITPAVIAELQTIYADKDVSAQYLDDIVDEDEIITEEIDTSDVIVEDAVVEDITVPVVAAPIPPAVREVTPTAPTVRETPTVDITVMIAAKELADICKATDDCMIHGYELEVDWDIDEMLPKIVEAFPDTFEFNEETDEIFFYEG